MSKTFDQIPDEWAKKLRAVYHTMRRRCENTADRCYRIYGGRGVAVDYSAWPDSRAFIVWAVNAGYVPGLTIDRIAGTGSPYSPCNCRWVTIQENLRKRVLTPEWLESMRQAGSKGGSSRSEVKLAALKVNIEKARIAAVECREAGVSRKSTWYSRLDEAGKEVRRAQQRERMRRVREERRGQRLGNFP